MNVLSGVKKTQWMVVVGVFLVAILGFQTNALAQESGASVTFDLSTPAQQQQVVRLDDGTVGVLGIMPAEGVQLLDSDLGSGTGSWKVYWYTGVLNTSYMVSIKNYSITRCYDNYSQGIGVIVDSCTLSWGSKYSTQTTRYHENFVGTSDTRLLKGNISGTKLITSVN